MSINLSLEQRRAEALKRIVGELLTPDYIRESRGKYMEKSIEATMQQRFQDIREMSISFSNPVQELAHLRQEVDLLKQSHREFILRFRLLADFFKLSIANPNPITKEWRLTLLKIYEQKLVEISEKQLKPAQNIMSPPAPVSDSDLQFIDCNDMEATSE